MRSGRHAARARCVGVHLRLGPDPYPRAAPDAHDRPSERCVLQRSLLYNAFQAEKAKKAECDRDLKACRKQVADLELVIQGQREQLTGATQERTALRTQVGSLQRQQAAVQQQVHQARRRIEAQERDLFVLRTCLVGVDASLGHVLDEDYDAALTALRDVQRECKAARKLVR